MNINEPLFSVLIANYNNGKYLQEAIDSVFAQTYTNWEVVIVDDKSTDDSQLIYDKYADDKRFRIFYNEKNMGCGYTKARCAELANGEVCGFLDPDDELLPQAIEHMVEVHAKHPEVSIVYSRSYDCDEKGSVIGENRLLKLAEGETYFDYRWYGSMHLATYKNIYYKKTEGISKTAKAGVDQDLYFKVEEVGKPFVLNEFTYRYYHRKDGNAITSGINKGKLWYWNMEVRKAACIRRGLEADAIICEDWKYIFNNIAKDAAFEKELEIKQSMSYRLGKFLVSPFSWMKRTIKGII